MLKTALEYLRAGLSVIPIAPDNKKPALNSWQQWQRERALPALASIWWRGGNRLAIVCGEVSGNLEMIDFDDNASAFPAWCAAVPVTLLDRLTIEDTPRGGKHVAYRCREIPIPGNQKLANNADNQTLIETRGEGGYFIANPSHGYILRQGGFTVLAEITQQERDTLMGAGRALNCAPPPAERVVREHGPVSADSPADEFNATHDFRDILESHGWHYLRTIGDNEHYQRPGKPEKETSATVKNNEVLFCFSTNAAPFEAQRGYSLFETWALLEHGGDMSAAAGAVVKARAPECRYRAVREAETTGAVPSPLSDDTPDATAAPVSPLADIAAWRASLAQPVADDLPHPLDLNWVRDFKPENDKRSILGNRFLCEGAQMLLIGQTGIGKSTFAAQWGITVAHAELFFGIKPRGALKSLFIQAENDDGDVAEMIQGTMRGMGRDDWDYLASKLIFIRESAKTGKEFCLQAAKLINVHKPDLIFADPLMSFIGGDIARNEVCAAFVRNTLTPILERVPCAWIWCHHTGKPPRDAKAENAWTNNDYSYYGIGGSDLSNAVRAIAIIRALDNDVYEFRLTKRERRAGLTDADGRATTAIRLEHSAPNEGSYWRYSDRAAPKEESEQPKIFSPQTVEKYEKVLAVLAAQPSSWRNAMRICETVFELKISSVKNKIWPELKRRGLTQTADGLWTAKADSNW